MRWALRGGGGRFGGTGGDLLFHALRRSTIGAEGFHGRVRDGIGCLAPRYGHQSGESAARLGAPGGALVAASAPAQAGAHLPTEVRGESRGAFSPAKPGGSELCVGVFWEGLAAPAGAFGETVGFACRLRRHVPFRRWCLPLGADALKPIERLVPVSCAGCPASTSGLSTWWSSTALERDLVLKGVSRLDAFSGYPVRT